MIVDAVYYAKENQHILEIHRTLNEDHYIFGFCSDEPFSKDQWQSLVNGDISKIIIDKDRKIIFPESTYCKYASLIYYNQIIYVTQIDLKRALAKALNLNLPKNLDVHNLDIENEAGTSIRMVEYFELNL